MRWYLLPLHIVQSSNLIQLSNQVSISFRGLFAWLSHSAVEVLRIGVDSNLSPLVRLKRLKASYGSTKFHFLISSI